MNYYALSRKEVIKIEKDFAKTVPGRKARLPVLLSMLMSFVWAAVSLGTIAMYYVSMYLSYCCGKDWEVKYIVSEPMSYLISFLLVMLLCYVSMINYNRELRDYIGTLE